MMIIFENSQQNLKVSYFKVGNTCNHFSICWISDWFENIVAPLVTLIYSQNHREVSHINFMLTFLKKCEHDFFQFVQKCNNFCSRFLLTIGCPMAFHNYPMDLQECNLKLQSCKYVPVSFCNLFKNGIKLQSPPSLASPYSLSKFEQIAILFGSYLILLLYQKVFQSSVAN